MKNIFGTFWLQAFTLHIVGCDCRKWSNAPVTLYQQDFAYVVCASLVSHLDLAALKLSLFSNCLWYNMYIGVYESHLCGWYEFDWRMCWIPKGGQPPPPNRPWAICLSVWYEDWSALSTIPVSDTERRHKRDVGRAERGGFITKRVHLPCL